jgi:hypothetical protein
VSDNDLLLLAYLNEDGSVGVTMPDAVDKEQVVASVIRAACVRGLDMGRVFRLLQRLRSRDDGPIPQPMVIQ